MITAFLGLLLGVAPGDYLPLAVGQRWVLRSPAAATPVVLEVTEEKSGTYRVRFDNPWIDSELWLRPENGRYFLTRVRMGNDTAEVRGRVVYFDLGARQDQSWPSASGTMKVLSRDKEVRAGGDMYRPCVQIRETNQKGEQVFWTFAPGVGFVQFGEGPSAFVLDRRSSSLPGEAGARATQPPAERGRVLIGLSANPFANEPMTPPAVTTRFQEAVAAGITFSYVSAKWNDLEPQPGRYQFKDVDGEIGRSATYGLPVVFNLRVIDTNQRCLPADLQGRSLADPRVRDRLLALIDRLVPRFRGRVRQVMVGNEIDAYFGAHRNEVGAYRELYLAAARALKRQLPRVQVSTTLTFGGLSLAGSTLKPLLDEADFLALTYYPLEADFTFRDPAVVEADVARMIEAAGGRKVLLQEIGYSTSPLNDSSPEKQARFVANVFASLEARGEHFTGANFFLMSDFSDAVVEELARYYKLPHSDRFRAFLRTLGMFDQRGRAKMSWEVFRRRALEMKGAPQPAATR